MLLISIANRIDFDFDIRVCLFVRSFCEIWGFAFYSVFLILFWFFLFLFFVLHNWFFSFKKTNNNAQGGQSRASVPAVNSSDSNASTPRGAQNGALIHPQLHGMKHSKFWLSSFFHIYIYVMDV